MPIGCSIHQRCLLITTTYIDETVKIHSGSKIFANCHLTGNTEIKENCDIGPNSLINDSTIGEGSKVLYSVVDGSDIESNGQIGPYAHLRTGSTLGDNVKVAAFAETKNSKISSRIKIQESIWLAEKRSKTTFFTPDPRAKRPKKIIEKSGRLTIRHAIIN